MNSSIRVQVLVVVKSLDDKYKSTKMIVRVQGLYALVRGYQLLLGDVLRTEMIVCDFKIPVGCFN